MSKEKYDVWKVEIIVQGVKIKQKLFKGWESEIEKAKEEARKWIGDKKVEAKIFFGDKEMGLLNLTRSGVK